METSPYILVSSLVSQLVVTWAYKHPNIAWVNPKTVQLVSVAGSSVLALVAAWAGGTLDQGVVQSTLDAVWNMIVGSGMAVAFYEWTKKKP